MFKNDDDKNTYCFCYHTKYTVAYLQGDTKKGNFWKTQQKLKKSKKKKYWQKLNHYNLPFKRQLSKLSVFENYVL